MASLWWCRLRRPGLLLWLLTGACCSLALLLYCCVRFDRQRRSAPNFQHRLREKRRKERERAKEHEKELCEQKDPAKVQEFFLQEIQLGELWLARGEHEKAIEHLAKALAVCTHPTELMHILEQILPPQIFEMLLHRISYATQNAQNSLEVNNTRFLSVPGTEEDIAKNLENWQICKKIILNKRLETALNEHDPPVK